MPQLQKDLAARGYRFNPKTIYRLAGDKPITNINAPVTRALCEYLAVDIGKIIVWQPPATKLRRVNAATQKRLDYLMAKSNEGNLSAGEQAELEKFATEMEKLSIENARILSKHAQPLTPRGSVKPALKRALKQQKAVKI